MPAASRPLPPPLRADPRANGLRRQVTPTRLGPVVAYVGRRSARRRDLPATLLLHGAAGSWTTWTPLLAAAETRGEPLCDVVAVDLPGWGESDQSVAGSSVEEVSEALVEVVRAAGYESWRIVGHSLGGFLALDIAARHPRATVGVTLVSASGEAVIDAIRHPLRGGRRLPGFAGMLLAMRMLALLGRAGTAIVRLLGRLGALPALTAPLFATVVHPSVVAAFVTEVRPAAFSQAAGLAADYEVRTWTAIRCPVRSVRGTRDVFAGEADAAGFARVIPGFRESRLSGAGHFAHIERADAVLDALTPLPVRREGTPVRAAA